MLSQKKIITNKKLSSLPVKLLDGERASHICALQVGDRAGDPVVEDRHSSVDAWSQRFAAAIPKRHHPGQVPVGLRGCRVVACQRTACGQNGANTGVTYQDNTGKTDRTDVTKTC